MKKLFFTDEQVRKYVLDIILQMFQDKFMPEAIFGVSRGGLVPGIYLSHALGVPFHAINKDFHLESSEYNSVLVVDEINDTGKTLSALSQLFDSKFNSVKYCTIVENTASCFTADYTGYSFNKLEEPDWIVFPWEVWWH